MSNATLNLATLLSNYTGAWDVRHDEKVATSFGWLLEPDGWHAVGKFFADWRQRRTACAVALPEFTRSIDDAMTLLPPPGFPLWTFTLSARGLGSRGMLFRAEITVPSREFSGVSSKSAALAITVAALRMHVATFDECNSQDQGGAE